MRFGWKAAAAVSILLLLTSLARAANTVPAGVVIQSGVGPAGIIETLDETQPPEPEAPPKVARQHPYEVPTEVFNQIKRRGIAPGDNGAKVIRAGSLVGRTQTPTVAPPLDISFTGLFASNLAPPDPCMAVGPNHIILSVNTRFNIYNKNGATQSANSYATFFSNVNTLPSVFDPKVVYDHLAGRWIVVILSVGTSGSNYLIAASDDSDPRGTWYKYSSPAHIDGSTPTTHGADYPGIGFDSQAVYITSNQFANFLTGSFMYSKIRIFKKSELYSNAAPPLTYTDITRMQDPSDGEYTFTIKPVIPHSPLNGTFLVNTQGSIGDNIELWRIADPISAPALVHVATIPIGSYQAPPDAVQPFGVALVNTNSSTIQSEVQYRNGKLYFAFPQAHNFGGGEVSAIRYLELDTSSSISQNIIYGADGEQYYFPAPWPLASGNVAMALSHSSASSYPSARYLGNFPDDLSAGILKAGDTTYFCNFCGGRNRWGDYAGIWGDPVSPRKVWFFHEYARKPQPNTWGTWCGSIILENHSPVLSDPGPQSVNEGETLAVNLTAVEPDGEVLFPYQILAPAPAYASFTNLGDGQGQLILTPGCFDVGVDTVYIVAADSTTPSLADTTAIEITVVENNCAPSAVRSGPDTVRINQCQNRLFSLAASDPDSSGSISFSVGTLPAFASVIDSVNGRGALSLSPTISDLGPYTIQVFASDGQDSGVLAVPVHVFQKGDLNQDGALAPADVVLLLNCIFLSLTPPAAGPGACDMDGGGLSISDVVVHLNATYLMQSLPPC